MKVAMVSTYRTQCGVGLYCEDLSYELAKLCDYKVFAEELTLPQTETSPLKTDINVNYERCWKRYQGYETLQQKLLEFKPDIVHFQFVAGVYNELAYQPKGPFQQFATALRNGGAKLVFTLHDIPQYFPNQEQLVEWYRNLKARYIVMTGDMSTSLHEWNPDGDITIIPLGTPVFKPYEIGKARKQLKINESDFLMTQIGFLGADKGMLDIIKAIPNINIPNFKLAFAGGFHPLASQIHKPYVAECMKTAIKLGVVPKIIFLGKILSEEEINLWASASNFLILNQEMIFGSSTSASAHRILFSGKPIIMSQSPKLSEFIHEIQCVKTFPDKITETVNKLYENKVLQNKISLGALEHGKKTTFEVIAKKHLEVYSK